MDVKFVYNVGWNDDQYYYAQTTRTKILGVPVHIYVSCTNNLKLTVGLILLQIILFPSATTTANRFVVSAVGIDSSRSAGQQAKQVNVLKCANTRATTTITNLSTARYAINTPAWCIADSFHQSAANITPSTIRQIPHRMLPHAAYIHDHTETGFAYSLANSIRYILSERRTADGFCCGAGWPGWRWTFDGVLNGAHLALLRRVACSRSEIDVKQLH